MAIDQTAVHLAIHELAAHPLVRELREPVFTPESAYVTFKIDVPMGSRWRARGESPNGVRALEDVRLDFDNDFPCSAPEPSLRPDFNRAHPHIQPRLGAELRVLPCSIDGDADEFVASRGVYALVDRVATWLADAAAGALINLAQGWEPVRRDRHEDEVVLDHDAVAGCVTPSGGYRFFHLNYVCRRLPGGEFESFFGEVGHQGNAQIDFTESKARAKDGWAIGSGFAIAVWAGRAPSGSGPLVCATYQPEDVESLDGLRRRAADLGMAEQLGAALRLAGARHTNLNQAAPLPVVLLVRRPAKVIGTHSAIEVIPYIVRLGVGSNAKVTPTRISERISRSLLSRLAGAASSVPWALLGCGSLGSKIALHRGRAGDGPALCGDKGILKPHNAARHALIPADTPLQMGWYGSKAERLAEALAALDQPSQAIVGGHRDLIEAVRNDKVRARWLVNTTASTVVREDLCRTGDLPHVVEAALFDQGRLGFVGVEGPGRNPNAAEVFSELLELGRRDRRVGDRLYLDEGHLGQVGIGQGCSSTTMVVNDADLSLMAAAMTPLVTSPPEAGTVQYLLREAGGLLHAAVDVAPYRRVAIEGLSGWELSVSARAYGQIVEEAGRHPKTETGGVLVGWSSAIARTIFVTSVMDAPPDSIRKAQEFVLGVEGLTDARNALGVETRGALRVVGTWHSHLGTSKPSGTDRLSAAIVALGETRPMAFLIHGTDGLRALSAAWTIQQPKDPGQ